MIGVKKLFKMIFTINGLENFNLTPYIPTPTAINEMKLQALDIISNVLKIKCGIQFKPSVVLTINPRITARNIGFISELFTALKTIFPVTLPPEILVSHNSNKKIVIGINDNATTKLATATDIVEDAPNIKVRNGTPIPPILGKQQSIEFIAVDFKSLCKTYLFVKKQTIHKKDMVQKKAIIQIPLKISDGFA